MELPTAERARVDHLRDTVVGLCADEKQFSVVAQALTVALLIIVGHLKRHDVRDAMLAATRSFVAQAITGARRQLR